MLSIKVYKKGDIPFRLAGEGHTGYAQEGFDIVCSAVSVLFQTLDRALTAYGVRVKTLQKKGFMDIMWDIKAMSEEPVKWIVKTVLIGLEGVVGAYPEYVRIESILVDE